MKKIINTIRNPNPATLLYREWLCTNGLGGFSCGSISNIPTRRQHGLLIASLRIPFGRTVMLDHIAESLLLEENREVKLSASVLHEPRGLMETTPLTEFKLEYGIPSWLFQINEDIPDGFQEAGEARARSSSGAYTKYVSSEWQQQSQNLKGDGYIFEKTLYLINYQNTLHITYHYLKGPKDIKLKWRPFINFRNYEQPVNLESELTYHWHVYNDRHQIETESYPLLRLSQSKASEFTFDFLREKVYYELENQRGYPCYGSFQSLGYYLTSLQPGEKITFIISTEDWETIEALTPQEAYLSEINRKKNLLKTSSHLLARSSKKHHATITKLILAADQFIISPITRHQDSVRLKALGEEPSSVIAGFPWFTDWGRDTMISLEGLTLTTERTKLAYAILQTFAHYIKDGLIPNMFPDIESQARYNTADATLWFFHAVDRYIQKTSDTDILEMLIPKFYQIIHAHIQGTQFGIKLDKDGLLTQGAEGLQLTWMDAKVDDWVVTPRRGKAVEINALWYNALRLMEEWTGEKFSESKRCYEAFNQRFWYSEGQYLYDVVDAEIGGNDSALRPNQIFAISLKYPVLKRQYWESVITRVQEDLLTPVGLRTLSPAHPEYKATYDGDLRSRDAAYHQGTVWPWLLGPFIDAWLKVYPGDLESVHHFLVDLEDHLESTCVGTVGEIFDAKEPFHPRGCFAQAWSVAEFLRCLAKVSNLSD